MGHPHDAQVSVVVIGYDDAAHVADAVRSALAQGGVVREVIAVDDCSSDGSAELLHALAAEEPRVRVISRTTNSGGCGTPRNDGIEAATAPYLMFLDSDDVLPPGAVDALLMAAVAHGTQLAAGLCVRRELPSGREVPWQPELYERAAVVSHPSQRPHLAHDTLCVNKLYRTDFLREHGIRFPDGRFHYEDFVFSARVLAAGPSIAVIPDTVYIWHVRRSAQRLSISLARADIENWKARMEATRQSHEILLGAGEKQLARAARTTFLDRGLRMYTRELPLRDEEYRKEWWRLTRAYLEEFEAADFAQASVPGRVVAQVVLASGQPRDLHRLKELAARPARLTPRYARTADGTPVWSDDLPQVRLEHLLQCPMEHLPVTVDAELRPGSRAGRLRLRLHELYGRVENARPARVDVEFVLREDEKRVGLSTTAELRKDPDSAGWTAEAPVDLGALGAGTWDLKLTLRFDDGTSRDTAPHAVAGTGLLRRQAVPSLRHGVLLVQPYATHSGALALRVASGVRGVTSVARRRLRRLLHLR
ncbi:glycosyltransferase family 2 protein [Streptomyces sp. NPDC058960]|uniref:glycosyltransferase family 2 protein n=1 Tax=Streptomyces sp. NPDC058960 TaxID=3346679 RepID=UPI0036B1053B